MYVLLPKAFGISGKPNARVGFAAKIDVSIVNGFAFLEEYSWGTCNEGTTLLSTAERYNKRTGYYPKKVLADKIYRSRINRLQLEQQGLNKGGGLT